MGIALTGAVALTIGHAVRSAAQRGPNDPQGRITVGGRVRTYRLHVPAPAPGGRRPLVIVLHGRGGDGRGMAGLTHFDGVADRFGFIAVYPDGVDHSWNDGLDTPAEQHGIDDVAFIRALIAQLVSHDGVDPSRVYATGLSNGAMFTELLGCRLAGTFAAIAPVAGPLPEPVAPGCVPARPLPVLEIHGTHDPWVPYGGGTLPSGVGSVLSAPATAAHWSEADRCHTEIVSSLPLRIHDGTSVQVERHGGCAAGAQVELYTVVGGGHTWPGGEQYLPRLLIGRTSRQFDASETIWRFFAAHT